MADVPAQPKRKRRVKNPETFRERAIKAAETEARPAKPGRLKRAGKNVLKRPARPVRASAKKLGRYRIFRILGKVLRLIAKVLGLAYVRNSWGELKLVTWPNWQQGRQLTFAVLLFAVIFGAAIAGVDYGLGKVFKDILLK